MNKTTNREEARRMTPKERAIEIFEEVFNKQIDEDKSNIIFYSGVSDNTIEKAIDLALLEQKKQDEIITLFKLDKQKKQIIEIIDNETKVIQDRVICIPTQEETNVQYAYRYGKLLKEHFNKRIKQQIEEKVK